MRLSDAVDGDMVLLHDGGIEQTIGALGGNPSGVRSLCEELETTDLGWTWLM